MGAVARHLNASHAQGVPSHLMGSSSGQGTLSAHGPSNGRLPSQPRVPIHLMMPASPQRPAASSRELSPSASDSGLQSRMRAAPTHVVPRYDVYGFALIEPPPTDAARQVRALGRCPEAPEQWARSPTHAHVPSQHGAGWERPAIEAPSHASNTALQYARRRAQRPDPSYDVDGDGFVSQRDYAIAKRHDGRANHPGSYGTAGALTETELRSAISEDMGKLSTTLPGAELGESLMGNRALASLSQAPDLSSRRGPKLTADRRNVTALWNRSSHQAKDCLTLPLEPPALLPGQAANTSSGLKVAPT